MISLAAWVPLGRSFRKKKAYELSQRKTLIKDIDVAHKDVYTIEFYYKEGEIHCRDSSILFFIECKGGSQGYLSSAYEIHTDTNTIDFVLSLKKKESI